MIFSENNAVMHVTASPVTPVGATSDTHFHSHHITSASVSNGNNNSYHYQQQPPHNRHHHVLQHNQYPLSHQRQISHSSYDTIDTSVWQHSTPPSSTLAPNRYNSSSNVDGMGGTMSWSDGSSGGSCVDDISEEEVEFDENGRRKVWS